MKSFLAFLLIPGAVLAGLGATRFAPTQAVAVFLPAIQSLKVPLSPQALPAMSRRDPAPVDFRYLMPLDLSTVQAVASVAVAVKVAVEVVVAQSFIVSAIFIDGERRVTQIGNETYQKGDSIAGYRVQQIEPMRVLLVDKSGSQLWVEMAKGF